MSETAPTPAPAAHDDTEAVGHSAARIGRAFGLQMAARVFGTGASLITVALTTRHLGPENYGYLTSAVMFVTLWMALTELGIGEVAVRRVTDSRVATRPSIERLVQVSLGFALVWSIPLTVVTLFTGVLIYHDDPEVVKMLFIVVGSIALTTLYSSFDPLFKVHMRFGAVALADFGGRILSMVLTVVLVALDAGLVWFAVVQLVPPAVNLAIKAVAAARLGGIRPVFDVSATRSLLVESLPITVVLVIAVLYWRIDGVLLSVLSTPEQVGHYGLAYSMAFMVTMVSELLLTSLLSTTTALYAGDRERFAAFVARTSEIMYFFAFPVAVIGPILAGPIITLISSDSFAGGAPVLGLLFIAAAVTFLNAAASQALFAAHDQHFLMRLNGVTLVINIAANCALIPHFGAQGAAMALVITELIGLACSRWRLGSRKLYHEPFAFGLRLLIPTIAAAAIALVLHGFSPLISLPAAAAAYLAINVAVGPVNKRFISETLRSRSDSATHDRETA
ncbi:flippase [Gordonia asplenii]|uniref:flippase n=1 Tax=Gordonia asplenii TaxID=2725283 RepID=UPI0028B17E2F|nr:flippase [Gordonia asplenii]